MSFSRPFCGTPAFSCNKVMDCVNFNLTRLANGQSNEFVNFCQATSLCINTQLQNISTSTPTTLTYFGDAVTTYLKSLTGYSDVDTLVLSTDSGVLQWLEGGGSGGGSVSSVSATDANGFDFTITSPSTFPDITLTTTVGDTQVVVSNSGAITGYSSLTFSSGSLYVGTAGTAGKLLLSGATSGTITLQTQAIAGTYNFNLPNIAGTSGYLLTSSGGGAAAMTWTDPASLIPTFQQTLTVGSTLTQVNTVDSAGHTFSLINLDNLDLLGTGAMTIQMGDFFVNTLTGLTNQDRIVGQVYSSGRLGNISIGTGLSLFGGVLSSTISSGADTALSNLASVAINTSLLPATDDSIDLGSPSKQWRDLYLTGASIYMAGSKILSTAGLTLPTGGAIRTSTSSGNTLLLQAYDVDGSAYVTFATLSAANTPTMDLSSSVTVGGSSIATTAGNVATATALQTARNIGGVSFNGTANIVPQTIESANEASDTTCFPLFITASGTQQLQPKNNTSLTFNSSTGTLGATTFSGAFSGNASTATALQTPRNIQGVAFDGTANIDIINGTGFVKATGTTLSYDNSTYLTTSSAASTYQPLNSNLTTIAGLTATTDNFIVSVASAWASRTPTQVKTTLSLNNVENTALSTWAGSTNITTLGTISTGVLTGATGLPISTGVSGLGTGVATFLATPSSANLATALTDETGTAGNVVFSSSPTITTPTIAQINGSTSSGGTLTLQSTTNGTKGKILFGTSGYDEVNNRLGIANSTPNNALDVTGVVQAQAFQTASTGANGNFFTGSTGGATSSTSSPYLYLSASTVNFKVGVNGTTASTITAGAPYGTVTIAASVVTEAASGTHPIISSLVVLPPGITAGVATVTNTSTIYVSDAPSASGATNYSLWLDAGLARADAGIDFNGASSPILLNTSAGTSGQVLTSAGAGATPTWSTIAGDMILASIQTVTGAKTFNAGKFILAAGDTSNAPINFTLGSAAVRTAATAGTIETDANGIAYYTHASGERGVNVAEQFVSLTSSNTLTSQTGVQPIFDGGGGPANGALTVASSKSYFFEVSVDITNMSGTSGTFSFAMGGTATLTSIRYISQSKKATLTTVANCETVSVNTASSTVLISASTAAQGIMYLRGIIRINAGGTIIPQIAFSTVAGPVSPIISQDSWIRLIATGTNTVASVGNWS